MDKPRLQRVILEKDLGVYDGNLKRTARLRLIDEGKYPAPVRLSERRKGWLEDELVKWQQKRLAERNAD